MLYIKIMETKYAKFWYVFGPHIMVSQWLNRLSKKEKDLTATQNRMLHGESSLIVTKPTGEKFYVSSDGVS